MDILYGQGALNMVPIDAGALECAIVLLCGRLCIDRAEARRLIDTRMTSEELTDYVEGRRLPKTERGSD